MIKVQINKPKLKNYKMIGEVIGYSTNYYNAYKDIPIVIVRLINHPYHLVMRIAEKNLTYL